MKSKHLIAFIPLALILVLSFNVPESFDPDKELTQVLRELGEEPPLHWIENVDPRLAAAGEGIVKEGHGHWPDGSSSSRQSKHFVCTDCHNTVREDPVLAKPDPEARAQMAFERGLPFLQGSTFWGMVNRETWYNDDYYKKYGDLVTNARDTLENAIQLCATVCSQGRALNEREMDAVLHYLWSLQLKMGDLDMAAEDLEKLEQDELDLAQKREVVKGYYAQASPARFVDAIEPGKRQYGLLGDASKGRVIYQQGCMHCHAPEKGTTSLDLGDQVLDFRYLKSKLPSTGLKSVYEIVRQGTTPIAGYKPYMPHYTLDRMSDQQIEDLVAYIKQQAQ